MSLVKYRNGFDTQFPVISDLFDQFFDTDFFGSPVSSFNRGTVPAVNVLENDDAFTLELAVPGRKKEDFKIDVNDNILRVASEVKDEKTEEDKKGKFTRKEFTYQSFSRAFTLPENVNVDHINATYTDGVLRLNIEKIPEVKPKEIEIK